VVGSHINVKPTGHIHEETLQKHVFTLLGIRLLCVEIELSLTNFENVSPNRIRQKLHNPLLHTGEILYS
jgi:hypothetical protein